MFPRTLAVAAFAMFFLLTACGGGSGGGAQDPQAGSANNTSTSSSAGTNSSNSTTTTSNPNPPTSTGPPTNTTPATGSNAPAQHVVVVVFENLDYTGVVGSSSMPSFNQLAQQYALATQFYANTHPSMGNYFWMTAGQDPSQGLDSPDAFSGTVPPPEVASATTAASLTWKVYAQSLPSVGYTGGDQYPYYKHHNPFAYFSSVLGDPNQAANIVNFTQFSSDIKSGSLPSYSFVVPDGEHDGHDCPDGTQNCSTATRGQEIDSFISTQLAPLLTNSSLMANTIVILTFDESDTDNTLGGGRIATVIAGGPIKTGYQSTTTYQFPSLLQFSLQVLGVNSYPNASASAPPMTEFLK